MKNIKALLLFVGLFSVSTTAFAQLSIGGRAGINLASQSVDPEDEDEELKNLLGLTVAGILEIGITDAFAIQPEISFIQKGTGSEVDFLGEKIESELKLNYIEVPVLLKYKFGSESFKAYIAAGPTLGYAASGKVSIGDESESIEDWDGFNRFEIGASAGLGFGFMAGPGTLFLDARYLLGFTNLNNEDSDDLTVKNKGIGVSVGYLYPLGE